MPVINPDFSERTLQPGQYPAIIVSCEQKISRAGNPYLSWKFETQTMDKATDRQWVFFATTFSGRGAQLIKSIVQSSINPKYESGPINTDDLLNQRVLVKVEKQLDANGSEGKFLTVTEVSKCPETFIPGPNFGEDDLPF